MTQFEFLSVALSFVLGLAVTVLLTSLVNAFRFRRKARMSWLPLTWAAYVLVMQFDLWWELYGLESIQSWSVGAFIVLLLLALLLFAAGALILPTGTGDYPDDLDEYFREDGRWGVAVIAAFDIIAIIANVALFNIPPFGSMNIWNVVSIGLLTTLVTAKRRPIQCVLTVVFGVWLGIYLWTFVPTTY